MLPVLCVRAAQASLQNLLELAVASLKAIPEYGNREVVLLYGSLTTCDPNDIFETVRRLVKHKIRVSLLARVRDLQSGSACSDSPPVPDVSVRLSPQVSIISLSAEMYICRHITEETKGTYGIAMDAKHFADLVMAQVAPPPTVYAQKVLTCLRGSCCRAGSFEGTLVAAHVKKSLGGGLGV